MSRSWFLATLAVAVSAVTLLCGVATASAPHYLVFFAIIGAGFLAGATPLRSLRPALRLIIWAVSALLFMASVMAVPGEMDASLFWFMMISVGVYALAFFGTVAYLSQRHLDEPYTGMGSV